MNRYLFTFCPLIIWLAAAGCSELKHGKTLLPASPQYTVAFDTAVPPAHVDVQQAFQTPATPLKLSRIASEIEYYIVGDANFPVTQAIAIPDSDAFITFNNPRIYYRKQDKPSKRFGFKALAYKWNTEMNGRPLFYDKATTRMFVALSGKDVETRKAGEVGEEDSPCIGELCSLDTMLTIQNYLYPETLTKKYPLNLQNGSLLGFSSAGYALTHYAGDAGVPDGIVTFTMQGDTLCRFQLQSGQYPTRTQMEEIPGGFQTAYWNGAQDRLTFMIPFCNTVYQLRPPHTIAPLYSITLGGFGIVPAELPKGDELDQKVWLRTLYENPKGLFMGLFQKNGTKILNWLDWQDEYKPLLTNQAVYLKDEGKTYLLPYTEKGFVNDLDGGLSFWPDGQTDDYLYMIRTVTEMREMIKRTGSPRQKKLIELLDNKKVHENQFVMMVVR